MVASTVDVECPDCAEKTPVSLREVREKGKFDITCGRWGAAFTLDATEAKTALDKLDQTLGKFPGWVKVERDF